MLPTEPTYRLAQRLLLTTSKIILSALSPFPKSSILAEEALLDERNQVAKVMPLLSVVKAPILRNWFRLADSINSLPETTASFCNLASKTGVPVFRSGTLNPEMVPLAKV